MPSVCFHCGQAHDPLAACHDGRTARPSWECGGCKAWVPNDQVTGSFYRGQAVCTDCEELFQEQAGVNQAMMQPRGPRPQTFFMDEASAFVDRSYSTAAPGDFRYDPATGKLWIATDTNGNWSEVVGASEPPPKDS